MKLPLPTKNGKMYIYAKSEKELFRKALKKSPSDVKFTLNSFINDGFVGSMREGCELTGMSTRKWKSWIRVYVKLGVVSVKKYPGMESAYHYRYLNQDTLAIRLKEFEQRISSERNIRQEKGKAFEEDSVKDFVTLVANSRLHIRIEEMDSEPFDFVAIVSLELPYFESIIDVGAIPISCKNTHISCAYTKKMAEQCRLGKSFSGKPIPAPILPSVLLCRKFKSNHSDSIVFHGKQLEILKKFREGIENVGSGTDMQKNKGPEDSQYID